MRLLNGPRNTPRARRTPFRLGRAWPPGGATSVQPSRGTVGEQVGNRGVLRPPGVLGKPSPGSISEVLGTRRVVVETWKKRYVLRMPSSAVVRGRLHGRHIELDEAVDARDGEVEVTVRPLAETHPTVADMLALIASFPPGTRTKEDVDQQIAEERAGWDRD
jgi:hypothetical protein